MAYSPGLNDIQEIENISPVTTANYSPSLNDIPVNQSQTGEMSMQPQRGALANFGLGLLDSVRNFGQDISNMPGNQYAHAQLSQMAPGIIPSNQLPQVPQGSGFAHGAGELTGDIGTFLAGGEGLDSARALAAAMDLPIISKSAQWLGGEIPGIAAKFGGSTFLPAIARQSIGGGIYGDITNPQNPGMGALKGAAISAPLAALPFIPSAISNIAPAFKPQALTDQITGQLKNFTNTQPLVENIVNQLSSGQSSIENSGKSLAQNIQDAYKFRKDEATNLYNQATSNFGDKNIYPAGSPGSTLGLYQPLNGAYPTITKNLTDSFSNDLQALHNQFLNEPTFNNAHELRKQLNSDISQYYKPGQTLNKSDSDELGALQQSKNALDQDINSFMKTQPADIANQYQEANNYFANNVAPYRDNRQIFKIAQGDVTNPRNIASIFKNPEPETQQVVSDLPDDAKNRILYSMLGKTNATKSPENLINAFNNLDQQGLSSYVPSSLRDQIEQLKPIVQIKNITQDAINSSDPKDLLKANEDITKAGLTSNLPPSLNDQLSNLSGTISRNKAANFLGGAAIGAGLGHIFGIPHLSPELLGLGGAFIGNKLLPPLYNSRIGQLLGRGISAGGSAAYSPLSTALRAAYIPGGQ